MLGNDKLAKEEIFNEDDDLEYSPLNSSSSEDEDDVEDDEEDKVDDGDDENEVNQQSLKQVDLEEVAQINLERQALESREIPKTRGSNSTDLQVKSHRSNKFVGGKLFSGHRFIQQEFPSDEEDEDFAPEESDSDEELDEEEDDEMEQEVIDNVHNVHQVYKKKELLVKDAKILRNMKEVMPVEASDLSERMEKLLNSA